MSTRIITIHEDDMTGESGEDVRTRRFSVDGAAFETELSDDHWNDFLDAVSPFTEKARKTGATARPAAGPSRTLADRMRSRDIRAWAHAQGLITSGKGRLSGKVIEKYDAAHGG